VLKVDQENGPILRFRNPRQRVHQRHGDSIYCTDHSHSEATSNYGYPRSDRIYTGACSSAEAIGPRRSAVEASPLRKTLPYEVGKPLKVKMYFENTTSDSITLFGGTHSVVVDKVPDDYAERGQLEKKLWAGTSIYRSPQDRPLTFQTLPTFAELASEQVLTQELIDQLAKGSVIYMMTIMKDARGKAVISSCFHTDPTGASLMFCLQHNSP
jgi:hypothetical protein